MLPEIQFHNFLEFLNYNNVFKLSYFYQMSIMYFILLHIVKNAYHIVLLGDKFKVCYT